MQVSIYSFVKMLLGSYHHKLKKITNKLSQVLKVQKVCTIKIKIKTVNWLRRRTKNDLRHSLVCDIEKGTESTHYVFIAMWILSLVYLQLEVSLTNKGK